MAVMARLVLCIAVVLALGAPLFAQGSEFDDELARVDRALKKNPGGVVAHALESCMKRRAYAIELYNRGQDARALRSLRYCNHLLNIPESAPELEVQAPTPEDLAARATAEIEKALKLEPDVGRGLEIYRECAACHTPEGWGLANGSVPQISGQHRSVVIKQLADIRAGNRDNVLMVPYSSAEAIGGPQAVSDVSAYIASLEITVGNSKGPGDDLEYGEKLYAQHCVRCHGARGEGDAKGFVPRIHAQHYNYLVRQFEWIRDGKRRNANSEMVQQIESFGERETNAVLDYVSRLQPREELQAPPGWQNPDFAPGPRGPELPKPH